MTHTLKKQVQYTLQNFPETRNSDALLTIQIWKMFHEARFPMTETRLLELMRVASQDNVKRIRAWFNQPPRRQYLPTVQKVAETRGIKQQEWEHYLSYGISRSNAAEQLQPQAVQTKLL